ncbi:MAG: hypothetical protein V6Z82_02820 [Flavobacteriales bacterium]
MNKTPKRWYIYFYPEMKAHRLPLLHRSRTVMSKARSHRGVLYASGKKYIRLADYRRLRFMSCMRLYTPLNLRAFDPAHRVK